MAKREANKQHIYTLIYVADRRLHPSPADMVYAWVLGV